jgi:hypothetical protein
MALPPQFDDCVRDVMQGLELPPMNVGDAFKVIYEFRFDSPPDERQPARSPLLRGRGCRNGESTRSVMRSPEHVADERDR